MAYIQKFPSLPQLAVITDHRKLPSDAKPLDSMEYNGKLYSLVKRGNSHLSVLTSETYTIKNGTSHYYCYQHDYPLRALGWFPIALDEFRKPPAQGGLHAGAMVSDYINVDGEMLTVGRTTDGYTLTNWSRSTIGSSNFSPVEIDMPATFLYQQGFLQLWQRLGERLAQGDL